ncbi:Bbp50 [Burkholderia sp. YI23]|nr:Bbp50 [Burkholderia sp. YI23]
MIECEPVLPTPGNIKYANRLIAEIRARIKTGAFRMTGYFPDAELAPAQESSTERPPTKAPKTINAAKATHDRVASPDALLHDPSPAPAKRRAMKAATELTVEAWLTQWLDMTRIETSTRFGYDAAVKFWTLSSCDQRNRSMGALPLASLKLSHVLTAIASRRELSGKTINNYVSVLRTALAVAIADELMPTNVAEAVARAKHQRRPTDPFSREELESIITEAAVRDPQIRDYIELWFWS